MTLEKIISNIKELSKREDLDMGIHGIEEDKTAGLIEVSCFDMISYPVQSYDEWLDAFQEHYNNLTGENADYSQYNGIKQKGMFIPDSTRKIRFEVDSSHNCFRFNIPKKDEDARTLVYKFIEKLMYSEEKKK
jgi:hypothetical protein